MKNRGYSRHGKGIENRLCMSALRIVSIDIDNSALKVRSCMVQRSLKSYDLMGIEKVMYTSELRGLCSSNECTNGLISELKDRSM
jgi:hypothetical protein